MAIENAPFIGDFPSATSIHRGFSTAMFDFQRVMTIWWWLMYRMQSCNATLLYFVDRCMVSTIGHVASAGFTAIMLYVFFLCDDASSLHMVCYWHGLSISGYTNIFVSINGANPWGIRPQKQGLFSWPEWGDTTHQNEETHTPIEHPILLFTTAMFGFCGTCRGCIQLLYTQLPWHVDFFFGVPMGWGRHGAAGVLPGFPAGAPWNGHVRVLGGAGCSWCQMDGVPAAYRGIDG